MSETFHRPWSSGAISPLPVPLLFFRWYVNDQAQGGLGRKGFRCRQVFPNFGRGPGLAHPIIIEPTKRKRPARQNRMGR